MDHTGCNNYLWVMYALYVVYLVNHLAKQDLLWRSSHEKFFGITPDILHQPCYFVLFINVQYLDAEIHFPDSKNKTGPHSVGIAENFGAAIMFWILTKATEQLIAQIVIRISEDPKQQNKI